MSPALWKDFWTCFHGRWASDKASPSYNKQEWIYLQHLLERREHEDTERGEP